MISHRERLLHGKKDDPTYHHLERAYKLFRNRITREIKKSKKKYYKEYFENNISNMKKTWQGIKEIINMNNKSGPQINQLNYKGKFVDNNKDIANNFNDFFTNIGPILDNEIPVSQRPNGSIVYLPPRIPHSFLISPTNPDEINDLINSLDDTKSCGPCSVPTKMLKLVSKEISIPLCNICNTSFDKGVFPDKNKIAKVIPSHKKGSTTDVNNYRPISLSSTFSKIMEKLMAVRLNSYLELNEIIYPKQFGFRAGYSTTHSLIDIVENIRKTIETRKYGCGVFIDLKKAFDTVNHDILLRKLEHYGIRESASAWFKSYLSDRKQYVHLNGTDSEMKGITCGVPQGSVLGPLLFLYISMIFQTSLRNLSSIFLLMTLIYILSLMTFKA